MIESGTRYKVSVAPASEPLTASEVKTYLKVDVSTDDSLITAIITAAREMVEAYTGRKLISQTIVQKWDDFPRTDSERFLRLAVGPLGTLSSLAYVDTAGASQTLASTVYGVDDYENPARIYLKYAQTWPDVYDEDSGVVTATYTAGYASASAVPYNLKQAMYLICADMYENRTDYVKRLPTAAEYLMDTHRVFLF